MSRKVVTVSDISAVNLIIGCCLLACLVNLSISSPFASHNENTLSMHRFHSIGFLVLLCRIFVSTADMEMSANATAIFCAHCGTVYLEVISAVELEGILFKNNLEHLAGVKCLKMTILAK